MQGRGKTSTNLALQRTPLRSAAERKRWVYG